MALALALALALTNAAALAFGLKLTVTVRKYRDYVIRICCTTDSLGGLEAPRAP